MQTHFTRRRRRATLTNKLTSAVESVVVQAVPEDRLVTADDLFAVVSDRCRAEGVTPPPRTGLPGLLSNLAEREFLTEVYGPRLGKFIDGLN